MTNEDLLQALQQNLDCLDFIWIFALNKKLNNTNSSMREH